MEEEAGLMVVTGKGGVTMERAVVVVADQRYEGGDEEADAIEEIECFCDIRGAIHDVPHEEEGVGLVIAEEVGEAVFECRAAPVGGEVAFAAAAEFVTVVEIGDGHPTLGGMDEGETVVEPNAICDWAKA